MSNASHWPDTETTEDRRRLFSSYVDGELSEDKQAAFERRLTQDAEFRREWEAYERMVTAVRGLSTDGADEVFVSDAQDALRRRSGGRFFGDAGADVESLAAFDNQTRLHEVAAAAMLALMLGAYLSFGPNSGELATADSPRLDIPPKSAERHR
jgi:anti-sigma factor RsiW